MIPFKYKHGLSIYLLLTGFLGHFLIIFAFFYLMSTEQLSARLLVKKAIDSLNIEAPDVVDEALKPQVKNNTIPIDGRIISKHPRIILPQLQRWAGVGAPSFIKERIANYTNSRSYLRQCGSDGFMPSVVCWLTTGDEKLLKKLVRKMEGFELNVPTAATTYSNGWQLALAYDLLFPALNESQRKTIEHKILQALEATLLNLDENSASLWHGRSTHATTAWVCAVVLSNRIDNVEQLQRRAQGYFLQAIDGLAYTEIWPGGYNYWIQNRGLLFALASSAYLNGVINAENAEKVKHVMRTVGYWTLYATRPDNKIEGYADEGSRVDLKDETRRVIDLIVQMTRDPVLAGYSEYLARLHGASYYSGYRWGFLLFNDPSVITMGEDNFASLGRSLSKARLFGPKTTNYAYFRSGWGEDDTFVSFKAGHTFSHHGHYDAGHFTIFKGAPLAINSSTYAGFFPPHRLNYAIRTIAKNSLLIQKPNEKVKPNRHFKDNISDGGQRLTMPTGSAVLSVADWFENYQQGQHFEGADLLNFAALGGEYNYISTDLTSAYNNSVYDENDAGGKISKAVRQLLYLPEEDHIIVYDRVISTNLEYQKKWLLHTINKPKVKGLTILKGDNENGILESNAQKAVINKDNGFLRVKIIYPEISTMRLVGGKDYQYYVETDADDTVFDGVNFKEGSSTREWHDVGMWRIEIQPKIPAKEDRFLVVMSPSLKSQRYDRVEKLNINNNKVVGMTTKDSVIIFVPEFGGEEIDFYLKENKKRLLLVGISVFKRVSLNQNGSLVKQLPVKNGIAYYSSVIPLEGKISIKW